MKNKVFLVSGPLGAQERLALLEGRAERGIEQGCLGEVMFELGPKGPIGSRQTENGKGCDCTKPSVGRTAWSGGRWQLGHGEAVSCRCT